ncbi:MBL fold metallo-hydrolase RNA specificity domain-containing protein [Robertkochia sediminum]|uniref:MBL fold metallo-hydrolase RNA specificity domain-containing protein n=1 Tax=Robertkochia sediminum TaxID=2785326 RepID=UPI00193162BE|nr:MBL fold metallo-hydrolase [Robertkochia sediminum]MBL7473008.1 MBL fold metallo-hydrolase [Robertkochia sediminum]
MEKSCYIRFLGAAGTVTGSKFLLETPDLKVLLDCGLFQGEKALREKNWEPLEVDAREIDLVVLTHGHLDHVGYLPRLVRSGFQGSIYATVPTLSIARIILEDSAKIQEEDADQANREGFSKHDPALPLYDSRDVERTFEKFEPQPKGVFIDLAPGIRYQHHYAGHILGATWLEFEVYGKTIVFSGDLGRKNDHLLFDPELPQKADVVIMESTYGDRSHPEEDVETILSDLVTDAIRNRGNLIVPSFAVERAQLLLYYFWTLYKKNSIPGISVVIDSPMSNKVLDSFFKYPEWHRLDIATLGEMLNYVEVVDSYRDTWRVIDRKQPKVVIAGSGMITGGRVLTYLQQLIDEPETIVLLAGFQAEGTRGRDLLEGASTLRFFGKEYPVRARVECLDSLSAHAGKDELLDWLGQLEKPPQKIFLVHGEPDASSQLGEAITARYGVEVAIPEMGERIAL